MNYTERIIAASLSLGVLCTTGFAQVIDNDDLSVTVKEQTTVANGLINVDVFAPGYSEKDLSGISKAELPLILPYWDQVTTDENGCFEITFATENDAKSGLYTFVYSAEGFKKEEKALITNDTFFKDALKKLNDAFLKNETEAKSDIYDILSENYADLGVYNIDYVTSFQSSAKSNAANLIYKELKGKTLTKDNVGEVFNKAVCILAIVDEAADNVFSDYDKLGIDKGELSAWYNKKYVNEATGKRIADRLKGKSFDSFSDFDNALTEAFILSVIEKPDGFGNTKEIMRAFSDKIGTGNSGSDNRYRNVSDKYYKNYSELKTAFDNYEDEKETTTKKSSSGGGGGSSSSKVSSAYLSPETEKEEQKLKEWPLPIFTDIEDVSWAEESIVALAEKGILKGKGENLFCPNDNVTREEFATILVRAFLSDKEGGAINFSDVSKDAWYYESISKAYACGIINGESTEKFGVGKNITRQDMALMIKRCADYIKLELNNDEEATVFEDENSISDYAKEAVYALKKAKIINGIDDYNFAPKDNATRAQVAKIISTLMSK